MLNTIYNFIKERLIKVNEEAKSNLALKLSKYISIDMNLDYLEFNSKNYLDNTITKVKIMGKLKISYTYYKNDKIGYFLVINTLTNKIIAKWFLTEHTFSTVSKNDKIEDLVYTKEFNYRFIEECLDGYDLE